jgi:hypothetical protein
MSFMAKTAAILPAWVQTLGAMLDQGEGRVIVRVTCAQCRGSRDIDITALAARVGRDYSLINRRCRCRLLPGCIGWNRFYYTTHVGTWTRPLADPETQDGWMG